MTGQRKVQLVGLILAVVALFTGAAAVASWNFPSAEAEAKRSCDKAGGQQVTVTDVTVNDHWFRLSDSSFTEVTVSVGSVVCQQLPDIRWLNRHVLVGE